MIVTLATQIIFRGIAEIVLGSRRKYFCKQHRWFPCNRRKSRTCSIHSFPGCYPWCNLCNLPWKEHIWTSCICNRYKPSCSLLFRCSCTEDPFHHLHIMGTCPDCAHCSWYSSSYGANTTTGNGFEMDAIAMAVFGGISSTGGKGNIAGGIISAFIIVCLTSWSWTENVNAQVILLIIGVLLVAAVALPNIIGDVKKAVAMKKN